MKIQTFIFVHDQNIILDFKKNNKFKSLENLKYVFLGSRDTDKVKNMEDVIICRELEHNIEDYPNLTSFSGWYALWKNKLYEPGYLNLFEYDINLSEDFFKKLKSNVLKNVNVVGYIPFTPFEYNYLGHKPWSEELVTSIEKNYKINSIQYLNTLDRNTVCSMTSNHTLKSEIFEDYINWVNPMIDDIKVSYYSGHQIERSISLYYLLNKIERVEIIVDVLHHFQFDSHKTQEIDQNKFINQYKNLLN
jgi:hypothetical protein